MLRAFPHLSLGNASARATAALLALSALVAASFSEGACVPTGSAPPWDGGTKATSRATVKQAPNVLTAVFEDNFDRPDTVEQAADAGSASPSLSNVDASAALVAPTDAGKLGLLKDGGGANKDAGADASLASLARGVPSLDPTALRREPPITSAAGGLGPNWRQAQTSAWKIENGRLCGKSARNHGVWLERPIPINARIEFDATTFSAEGDLKAEVWGDGQSAATSVSYTNATSYLTIFGGWKNTFHVLARINEHGTDRKEIKLDKDSDDTRQHPVALGQSYRFKIERTDGKTVHWFVNGVEYLKYEDPEPLAGIGHDHFGFNDWEAKVCFDNVRVTPL